jgi:hypothetical protein
VGFNKVVEFNGKMYELVRSIRVEQVNGNMEGLRAWRDKLGCDHVLRHQDHFLMVRFVDDIEWEEI